MAANEPTNARPPRRSRITAGLRGLVDGLWVGSVAGAAAGVVLVGVLSVSEMSGGLSVEGVLGVFLFLAMFGLFIGGVCGLACGAVLGCLLGAARLEREAKWLASIGAVVVGVNIYVTFVGDWSADSIDVPAFVVAAILGWIGYRAGGTFERSMTEHVNDPRRPSPQMPAIDARTEVHGAGWSP